MKAALFYEVVSCSYVTLISSTLWMYVPSLGSNWCRKILIQNSLKPLGGLPFTSFCFRTLSALPIVIKALYSNRCRDLQNQRHHSPSPLAVNYCFMCHSLSLAFLESLESFQDSLSSGRPVSECNLSFIDCQKLSSKEIPRVHQFFYFEVKLK